MCSCVLVFWCILCCWMAVVRAVNERVWHYDQNIVQIFNQNRGEQQQKNAGKTSTKIIMDACKQTYLCVPYICFTVSIRCAAVAAFSHIYHHMPFPLSSVNIWIHQTDPIGKIAFHRSICVNSTRCDFFRIVGYFFFINIELEKVVKCSAPNWIILFQRWQNSPILLSFDGCTRACVWV